MHLYNVGVFIVDGVMKWSVSIFIDRIDIGLCV